MAESNIGRSDFSTGRCGFSRMGRESADCPGLVAYGLGSFCIIPPPWLLPFRAGTGGRPCGLPVSAGTRAGSRATAWASSKQFGQRRQEPLLDPVDLAGAVHRHDADEVIAS